MKKLLSFLFSLVITGLVLGGNINLYISGYVFDEATQEPINNQLVTVKITNEEPLLLHFEKLFTNESGFYSSVIELPFSSGIVKISTIDCNNQVISHSIPFNPLKTHITANFVICHNPLVGFCLSDFLYVPDAQFRYKFYFKETSWGNIQNWLWNFGDGNFSTEPNPQHTYNVEGLYNVCLTVTDAEGTCTDVYCETLSIFEETLCDALFTSFPFSGIDNTIQCWDLSSGEITFWEWDFGDGTTSLLQNPVHTFQFPGTYTVCLEVNDASGNCTSTYCVDVEVNPIPECVAGFTSFYNQNNPFSVQFLNLSQGDPDGWLWDFGDGTVSFSKDPVHEFPQEGVYDVCLSIFNQTTGCQDEFCSMVMVYNQMPCNSYFNYFQFPVDPATYQFVDMSSGIVAVYHWDFGDGNTSEYQNPVHSYYEAGSYEVCLTVTDESGICNSVYCETIHAGITPDCEADFYYLQDSINPLTFHFSDISSGNADIWEWDFGDGSTSNVQNTSHIFPGEGVYLVSLTISNNSGTCYDEICREVIISGQQTCQAFFNFFIFPENPFMVQFIDFSTGIIDVWIWDFGDGTYSLEKNPIHVYQNEDDYTVCLYVMNTSTGFTDQYCKDIQISYNPDCFADFTFLLVTGDIFSFQFADQSGGNVVEWLWEFGDGNVSTVKNPVHTFSGEGVYETCITVKNLMGNCQETTCKTVIIDVPDLCSADFGFEPITGQMLTHQFIDKSAGILNRWVWDFGDGVISDLQNPVHTFADSGVYNVQLSVFHNDSIAFCNSTILKQVSVYAEKPFCQANFTAVPDSGINKPYLFHFQEASLGEPDSWLWDFGDGSTSTEQNPTHQYSETGNFQVTLTITSINPYGENGSDSKTLQVTMPEYYHVGGSVYANGYPLNNPVHNGDTIQVIVYRYKNEDFIPLDTASFTNLGYYYFLNLLESNYLIKFALTNGSTHFSEYFPTYYGNNLLWHDAGLLPLADSNFYHADVSLLKLPESNNGVGQILGTVTQYLEKSGGLPLPAGHTEVLLFNSSMEAIKFRNTSTNGDFRFSDVPYGTYYLMAESAGLLTEAVAVTISGTNPVADNIQLSLYSSGLTVINNPSEKESELQIYPNPVTDYLNVTLKVMENDTPEISISGISGQKIPVEIPHLTTGKNTISINVTKLPRGVYVIKLVSGNGHYHKSLKFIK